jgi:ACS family hexuronate transporter-like MFS transporter
VAEWFPRDDRALAVGIVTVGPALGALLAPPLLGALVTGFGWQAAFIVPGLLGFFWLWVWQSWYQSPDVHPGLAPAERQLILQDRDEPAVAPERVGWTEAIGYLRYRQVWGLVLSRFANDGAFYFFVSWLPLYLTQTRGFDMRQIATFAWMPFLAADLGSLTGGGIGRRLMAAGVSLDVARKRLIWTGALLVPLALPALAVDSAGLALALTGMAMFAIQFKAANLFALPADIFPARQVGSIWGLFGAVGSLGGMAFVAAVGWVSEHFSYEPVFWAVGVTQVLSACFISWFIPQIEPLRVRTA